MSLRLRRKTKKGISGAVTALILVIASVIIALVVVGFAFGLFGAFAGKPTVTQIGTGSISSGQGGYIVTVTLESSAPVTVVSAQLANNPSISAQLNSQLPAGTTNLSFTITGTTLVPGNTYDFVLSLSDGSTVTVAAYYP